MASATIITDLSAITPCNSLTADGSWGGAVTATLGTTDPPPLEGTGWVGGIIKKSGDDMMFTPTTPLNMTGKHLRWIFMTILKPNLETTANSGITLTIVGSTSGTAVFKLSGTDTYVGGWEVLVVNPYATPDSGTQVVGNIVSIMFEVALAVTGKSVITTQFDYLTYGTGFRAYGGTSGDEIGMVHIDAQDVYYLLANKIKGVYEITGKFQLGDHVGTNSCYFKDSGKILIFQDLRVDSTFYEFKVAGNATGTTVVDLSGNFITSVSKAYVVNMIDATYVTSILIDGTTFQRALNGVNLCSVVSGVGTVFDICGPVDPGGATLDVVTIKNSTATGTTQGSLMVNISSEGNLCTNMSFSGYTGATTYAVYVAASVTEFDMDNWYFSDPNNTTSYALYWAGTGGTLTINASGGTNLVTAGCTSAGGTVEVIVSPVTCEITVKDTSSPPVAIENANVLVWVTDNANYFSNASVTISASGTTATVAHTAHGAKTGDFVIIKGAAEQPYNGPWEITVTGVNAYQYTMLSSPTSPATGTITSTFAVISGLTNSSGIISDTRTWTANQAISGWARKSTSTPFYQQGVILGTINTTGGFSTNVLLLSDE